MKKIIRMTALALAALLALAGCGKKQEAAAGDRLAQEGMTMLVVTHEMNFARNVSSKVVFMEGGVVVEESRDPKAFFQNPSQERSRAFLRTILGETEQEEIQ